ncbi:hypothetical protein RRG08_012552 [Elysia crispata]|uniref:Uncharacterized protein n=1 Tax=Elysia crispata TaxID=231223 RepID=A0AAE1E2Q8_9GAST|nr:hypothetical protein RRG08_012552 [Elysia crispata]
MRRSVNPSVVREGAKPAFKLSTTAFLSCFESGGPGRFRPQGCEVVTRLWQRQLGQARTGKHSQGKQGEQGHASMQRLGKVKAERGSGNWGQQEGEISVLYQRDQRLRTPPPQGGLRKTNEKEDLQRLLQSGKVCCLSDRLQHRGCV